jgi:hypothetical protein
MTERVFFSDPPQEDNERFGVITGTFALSRFPNVPGTRFRLKAASGNAGSIFIGNSKSTGSYPSNPKLPWQLGASADTDWFSANNLNQYYQAGSSGSSYLSYWAIG